jgi:hypothetical protein
VVGAPGNGKAGRPADSEDPAMQPPSTSDYLAVLRGELIEHLRRARAALEPVGDGLGAVVCAAEAGQALAVLRPLGLELLGMLAEEIGRLATLLEVQPEARRSETTDLLRHAIDQLRDGVERRALGRPEGAWAVLAVLNELRAALGMPLVSQARLFAPDLEAELALLAAEPGDPHPEFPESARAGRIVLHRAMYLWYSGREPERALRKLRRVAQTTRRVAGIPLVQRLFLMVEAFAVGVADQGGPPSQVSRRLLQQVDGLLKIGAESGERAVAAAVPASLVRNLLFQVGSSGSMHRIVQSVRRSADLRLLSISGFDGRERLAPLLRSDVARVRGLLDEHLGGRAGPTDALAEAVHGLSDSLGFAQLGDQRRQLDGPLATLSRVAPGQAVPAGVLGALQTALMQLDTALRTGFFAPLVEPRPDRLAPAPVEAARVEPLTAPQFLQREKDGITAAPETERVGLEGEPLAVINEVNDAERGSDTPPVEASAAAVFAPLEEDIRDVFVAEAPEKVEAMRDAYVAWSAHNEDEQALAAILRLLGELKSTGRLVGAHTLSEVCWVLHAVLERCRDGVLPVTDAVFEALDRGVETVDALLAAHVSGTPVEGDPRVVEQRLYSLLAADASTIERLAATSNRPHGTLADAATRMDGEPNLLAASDLSLADLLADEAGDLVETLQDGLEALATQQAQAAWLVEMRRALRSLASTARYAQSSQLAELAEAFEAVLATDRDDETLEPGARALAEEAFAALKEAVVALRDGRAPWVPLELLDRLRRGEAAGEAVAGPVAISDAVLPLKPDSASRRALEEQVAALRDYVGQLEGMVARFARLPLHSGADLADRARAIEELGHCADNLHEVGLAIGSLVRGRD